MSTSYGYYNRRNTQYNSPPPSKSSYLTFLTCTHAGPPHCPWCQYPTAGALAFFAVAATQATVVFCPGKLGLWPRLGLAITALPLVGGATGLLQGWLWGYFL